MFANVEELQAELLGSDPSDFVSRHLFENVPFVFGDDLSGWITWKASLAGMLEVDPREIVMIGSAATGYSLSPNKSFSAFGDASDVDVGVISGYHFDIAWRHLRQKRADWLMLDQATKAAIRLHQKSYVFSGTIATDRMLGILPFGRDWQAALDLMSEHAPTLGREVKLRIYRDFDALRYYHSSGIRELQVRIAAPDEGVAEIPEEG